MNKSPKEYAEYLIESFKFTKFSPISPNPKKASLFLIDEMLNIEIGGVFKDEWKRYEDYLNNTKQEIEKL
jgi:hypothetical protein